MTYVPNRSRASKFMCGFGKAVDHIPAPKVKIVTSAERMLALPDRKEFIRKIKETAMLSRMGEE